MNKYLHYLLTARSSERGYDPYNPELPKPLTQGENGALKYNPGSYNLNNNTDYNPTPLTAACRSSKYTLDTTKSKARLLSKASTKEQKGTKRNDADLEYRPTSSRSQTKVSSESKSNDDLSSKEKSTKLEDLSSREMKEMAVQYDMEDIESSKKNLVKQLSEKSTKVVKKEVAKTDGNLKKPEKKLEKVAKKEKSKSTGCLASLGKSKKEGLNKSSSTEKLGSGKKDSKVKSADLKNGKQTSSGKHKGGKTSSEKLKEKGSSGEVRNSKKKPKQGTLSHVDLFGDESGEEDDKKRKRRAATCPNVSSDSDVDDCSFGSQSNDEGTKNVKCPKLSRSSSSSSTSDIDYSILERDLDYDSDPMEECLRIFNESTDVKTEDKGRLGKQPSKEEGSEEKTEDTLTTLYPGQKRRISHLTKQGNADVTSKPVIRPYRPPTAQEEKRGGLLTCQMQPLPQQQNRLLHARTLAGMASKTSSTNKPKRIAHAPSLQSTTLKRPVIPTEFGAKVPTNIRQRYLNLFIDECLKFCSSAQEAFDKALSEEKVAYERSTSRNIYLNVAVNTLKKLRSLAPNSPSSVNKASNKKVVSHEAVLGGKLAAKTSFTLNRSGSLRAEDLTGSALYRRLKEYLLTEEQLKENGYPMPHPEKMGRAIVFTAEEKKTTDSSCRICCRCGTEYMVSASGNCIRKEECLHHWGRLRKQKVPGGWETHYSCCSGAVGSPGCQVAKQHVQDGRKESLDGFVKTFEKLPTTDGYPGIFALDCEMCYTKQGLELTRITVINSDLKVVYDTFVKPDNKVVDYNTRFSGVTEEDLANTSITLRDVQAVLLNMFSADTILIGHSLESDLFALKFIHCTVVDTSVVFPHRLGMPYKRALRTLMADYLKRIIQDNVEGHDSSEDARACMELMIWKIKEDAKVKR
ncbi:RNA exonuclease 1-like protein isoform C [Alligator mississippiensis]|uniref:RNA exonuclease 1-like protein isoform C n=1 Tax=Alligator mississippiensis TaxID=8496 RepID=A0A151NGP4_ALLMI|nr:RNA exonuclease 1-like protein isoform C [Alligator mississippiensis]